VLPAFAAKVKLPPPVADDDLLATMGSASPLFESPVALQAVIPNVPIARGLEPTEIAMLPPDPEADEPLPTVTAQLVPTVTVPLLKVTALDTPKAPAGLVGIADTCLSLLPSIYLMQ